MNTFKEFVVLLLFSLTIYYFALVLIKYSALSDDYERFLGDVLAYDTEILNTVSLLIVNGEDEMADEVGKLAIGIRYFQTMWTFDIFDWTENTFVIMPFGHIILKRLNYWREHDELPPLSDPDIEYNPEVQSV